MRRGLATFVCGAFLLFFGCIAASCDDGSSGAGKDDCVSTGDASGPCPAADASSDVEDPAAGQCGSKAAETTLRVTVQTDLANPPGATLMLYTYFEKPGTPEAAGVADGPMASFDAPTFPVVHDFTVADADQVWVAAIYALNATGDMLARDTTDSPIAMTEGKISCLTITLR